jgi:hypothetical protein
MNSAVMTASSMAVRSVFKSFLLLDAPAGSIHMFRHHAAFRLYDGKNSIPIQSTVHGMSEQKPNGPGIAGRNPAAKPGSAAERALAEAEARRAEYRRREAAMPKEIGGRGGNEPGRYGDWEIKGLTSDF